MSAAISDSFATLLRRIQPVASEVRARHSHAGTIRQAVRGEFSAFNRLEVFGSHTRDTAVHIWSDVDYLAVLEQLDVNAVGDFLEMASLLIETKSKLVLPGAEEELDLRHRERVIEVLAQLHRDGGELVPRRLADRLALFGRPSQKGEAIG